MPTGPPDASPARRLERTLVDSGRADELAVVIASAGSTNAGVVDELGGTGTCRP